MSLPDGLNSHFVFCQYQLLKFLQSFAHTMILEVIIVTRVKHTSKDIDLIARMIHAEAVGEGRTCQIFDRF
jgi:hypothetical protein